MIDWIQVVTLSLIQGLTEFLPVSSSAHLILVPALLGWQDQGLAFDIAVHVGTLFAVFAYFKDQLIQMGKGLMRFWQDRKLNVDLKVLLAIGFATIPVGLFGLLGKNIVETSLRSTVVIALATIGFGGLLWVADRIGRQRRSLSSIHWLDVLAIGIGQALSLIPGTSRSGITLTFGLFRGLTREAAATFSFLLSIPVIVLAGGLEAVTLIKSNAIINWNAMFIGACISGVSGYLCIVYFLKLIDRIGVLPFVIYRFCLGTLLLYLHYA